MKQCSSVARRPSFLRPTMGFNFTYFLVAFALSLAAGRIMTATLKSGTLKFLGYFMMNLWLIGGWKCFGILFEDFVVLNLLSYVSTN